MKVDVKKVDPVKRELKFKIEKERVSQKFEEVYKDLGKEAKIKGFRKGKVPRHVLEAEHSAVAQEEVIRKLIPEVYQEGIESEKLHPIEMPEIEDVNLKDGELSFTAKLDIKPEVTVGTYKGIKVKRKSNKVTDEDINKTLDYFKEGQGKDKKIEIDDEFAKGLGYPSLEEFKTSLTRQLELDKDRANKADVENQVVDVLLKGAKLTVPQSLVKKHLEHRVNEAKHRLKHQGMSDDEIGKKDEEIRKELSEAVEKDVKVYLVLDKIAELENLEVNPNENLAAKVMEFLLKEAKWEEAK